MRLEEIMSSKHFLLACNTAKELVTLEPVKWHEQQDATDCYLTKM